MKKIRLGIIHPLQYSIRIVDQALMTRVEQIRDLRMKTRGMDY